MNKDILQLSQIPLSKNLFLGGICSFSHNIVKNVFCLDL